MTDSVPLFLRHIQTLQQQVRSALAREAYEEVASLHAERRAMIESFHLPYNCDSEQISKGLKELRLAADDVALDRLAVQKHLAQSKRSAARQLRGIGSYKR